MPEVGEFSKSIYFQKKDCEHVPNPKGSDSLAMADGRQNRRHLKENDRGLYEAALVGDLAQAEKLLKKGANVNIQDSYLPFRAYRSKFLLLNFTFNLRLVERLHILA